MDNKINNTRLNKRERGDFERDLLCQMEGKINQSTRYIARSHQRAKIG